MTRTLDRFELMRLLVRIAETGSLSAAGRSLGLSQPSVSRKLRALESEVGAQLVMRTTHDLALTEAGEDFLGDARQILAGWDAAIERVGVSIQELRGTIRVAAPMGMGQTILADLAGSFARDYPGVSLDWLLVDEPRDLIAEGIDLWIRVGTVSDESLIVKQIWTIERAIVSARAEDVGLTHPAELKNRAAVVLGPYVGARIGLKCAGGGAFSLVPKTVIRTDNIFAAERMTVSKLGYSILPFWLVDGALEDGRLHHVCPEWSPPSLSLSIAYPQTRFRPARVRAFIDYVKTELSVFGRGISSAA